MSDPPASSSFWSGLWQKIRPLLFRETMVALDSLIAWGQLGRDRLQAQATTQDIPDTALNPESSFLVRLGPPLQSLAKSFWNFMGWLRARLPQRWQERMSQSMLTTLVTALIIIGVVINPVGWVLNASSSPTPARPTLPSLQPSSPPIAVQPLPDVEPSSVITDLTSLEEQPVPITAPVPPAESLNKEFLNADGTIASLDSQESGQTPELDHSVESVLDQPTETQLILESPPPPPELSPEEAEIADVRSQILALSDRYRSGITQTLTVNLVNHTLEVMLSGDWYNLNTSKQDDLAQDLWQRSQDLGFQHFTIVDPTGDLLVRNPVIGNNAIVLHRKLT